MGSRFIRPSQFVTTYGVGSLIRLGHLHRVIPSLYSLVRDLKKIQEFDQQDRLGRRDLDKFRINDRKMERIIQGILERNHVFDDSQIKIFRLPSNADLSVPDGKKLYSANIFPKWSICSRHMILAQLEYDVRDGWVASCPKCKHESRRLKPGVGVRFIRACHRGHMDDLNWHWEVHQGAECNGNAYSWDESDNNFEVKCLTCDEKTNYFSIRARSDRKAMVCDAYWPETGSFDSDGCFETEHGLRVETAKLILKNASNLRIAQISSSLVIPPYSDRLYNMLKDYAHDLLYVPNRDNCTKKDVINHFQQSRNELGLSEEFFQVLEEYSDEQIRRAVKIIIQELQAGSISETESEESEFEQLLKTSKDGYPKPQTGEPALFFVDETKRNEFHSKKFNLDFVVAPVGILHVTMAQVGYRREVKPRAPEQTDQFVIMPTGNLIPAFYNESISGKSAQWFIGSQLKGEGIFIYVEDHDVFRKKDKESFSTWMKLSEMQNDSETRRKANPNHVWWHSLAHRLVTDLSIDSGFQNTAIHEKTYSHVEKQTGKIRGGILLYAVQPGGDGTLGGLTGLVPSFDVIMDRTASRLISCSNDPVCVERKINPNRVNGAACHACMLISETSCGMQNKFLDRKLLMGTMDDS